MNKEISQDRVDKFDFKDFEDGDTMLFCHDCDWQSEPNVGMKPECPNCGEHLYLIKITDDIIQTEGK